MSKKIMKAIISLGIGSAAIFSASPAYAWWEITYYYANGSYAGYEAQCDNGYRFYFEGTQTNNYVIVDHPNQPPC